MPAYTHMNLNDVEDMAPKFGMPPGIEARFASHALELEKSGFSYQRYDPGFRVPFGHKHEQQEELYVIVEGGGRLKLDDEVIEVGQWDAVRVPGEIMRGFEAGPEGAALLAFGAPNTGSPQGDAEMVPGWWSD